MPTIESLDILELRQQIKIDRDKIIVLKEELEFFKQNLKNKKIPIFKIN